MTVVLSTADGIDRGAPLRLGCPSVRLVRRLPLALVAIVPSAFVYLLRCGDDSLYCGWTSDLERRLAEHAAGTGSRYTRSRLPVEVAWSRPMASRSEAMREEARIKRLSRAQKLRLAGAAEGAPSAAAVTGS
jgi:putative endonuclease